MEPPRNRRDDEPGEGSTAARIEDWLRGLQAQRVSGGEAPPSRPGRPAGAVPSDDAAEAFLRAARRLAASPHAQEALARRISAGEDTGNDPSLRALARVLRTLGAEISGALDSMASMSSGGGSGAAVLEPPEIIERRRELDDDGGGGGDDVFDDDDDGGGGGDDDEPWPSAFIGYRIGVVDSVDVGNCRDGCCTAVFLDHPGLRAAIWFPTEAATGLASQIGELLDSQRGETADLGVPPFGAGQAPARGQIQAAIQFFTEDLHLDPAEDAGDRRQGGFARLTAYDQSLGHGGPPLVDALFSVAQARALRRALRKAARNMPTERE